MQTASGAHAQDTPPNDVHRSHNASSAMEQDISRPIAATPINDAEKDGSVVFPTTTHVVPTPPVPQTSEPSDNRKDVEWRVMSQETSQHVTQRGDSPLIFYDSL